MISKVKFHIPIVVPEQIVVRDEIAKELAKDAQAVILSLEEGVKEVNGEYHLFPVSVVEVYLENIGDQMLDYFKQVASIIAERVGDSVVLEITKETSYIGTAEP